MHSTFDQVNAMAQAVAHFDQRCRLAQKRRSLALHSANAIEIHATSDTPIVSTKLLVCGQTIGGNGMPPKTNSLPNQINKNDG
jgi:hypothetical protein